MLELLLLELELDLLPLLLLLLLEPELEPLFLEPELVLDLAMLTLLPARTTFDSLTRFRTAPVEAGGQSNVLLLFSWNK